MSSTFPAHWQAFLDFLAVNRIGDLASLAGIVISLVGFGVTVWTALRAKRAAVQAAEAARDVAEKLTWYDLVHDLTTAIDTLDEIKRLRAANAGQLMPERFGALKRTLVKVVSTQDIGETDRINLENMVVLCRQMEKKIWKEREKGGSGGGSTRDMDKLIDGGDRLYEVLLSIRRKTIGGDNA